MAGVITERQMREDFRRVAENFKRCLVSMGYKDARRTSLINVPPRLDVFENSELKITFVIDYGEYVPSSMNIRMKAKGVWTNIYMPYPQEENITIPLAEGTERLYDETGGLVACQECGCIDFVKKGEEHVCALCCQGNPGEPV